LRRDLLSAGESLKLRSGQVLFQRGDRPLGFYGVVDGSLKVSTMREDGREGVLGLVETGNWFGEASLVERSTRAHDVTTMTPSSLIVVPPAAFNDLMRRPAFSQAISVLLAGRVHRLYGALEDTMLRSLLAQVARRLLHLAQGDASAAASRAARTTVPVSQELLATMLGVTRQTLAAASCHSMGASRSSRWRSCRSSPWPIERSSLSGSDAASGAATVDG
jgi:CRP-like cAMP-binding protein